MRAVLQASLLRAVSYIGSYRRASGRRLVGLFAGMYYAWLRPEEAVAVTLPDCVLPAEGWGTVFLHNTRPRAGKKWTDSGQLRDERGLKGARRGTPARCLFRPVCWRCGERASTPSVRPATDGCSSTNEAARLQHVQPHLARSPGTSASNRPGEHPARG